MTLTACVVALLTGCASVPIEGPVSADRPGYIDLTSTVPDGVVQTEMGYTQTHTAGDSYASLGEGLIRIGYAPRAELRIHTNSFARLSSTGRTTSGLEDIRIGTKVRLVDAPAAVSPIPAVSVLASTSVPTGASGFGSDRWQAGAKLAVAWGLPAGFSLATNVVADAVSVGNGWYRKDSGGAALSFAATPQFAPYAGYYAWKLRDGVSGALQYVDTGFGLLLNSDLQIDVRAGVGANSLANDHFVGVGIVRRW